MVLNLPDIVELPIRPPVSFRDRILGVADLAGLPFRLASLGKLFTSGGKKQYWRETIRKSLRELASGLA